MITPSRPGVRLRPATTHDDPILRQAYASAREAELDRTGWSTAQREAFVAMQYAAQDRDWRGRHDPAAFFAIEVDARVVGRLYLAWLPVDPPAPPDLRVVDLLLVPSARGRGIGGSLLADVVAHADAVGAAVSLHVEHDNPARRLYDRHGFEPAAAGAVHVLLRRPAQLKTAS